MPWYALIMAQLIEIQRPPKLTHVDGEPVIEILALVWWQGVPIPREAWFELAQPETNGWLDAA